MPSIKVKKGGVYTDPVGIFAKKAGVYSAVQGVSAKVAGVYTRVDQTPDQQVAALFASMSDPAKPLPGFIEGWAVNSFNGVANAAPAASGAPVDTMAQSIVEYAVTGALGDTSLVVTSGTASYGPGVWGGVIQHDDGTYGLYTVFSVTSGSLGIYPPLRAATTAKTLRNIEGQTNGQHMTEPGYRALARSIFSRTKGDAYRLRYASKWTAANGIDADWVSVGGAFRGMTTGNSFIGTGLLAGSWIARGRTRMTCTPNAPTAGKGCSKTFPLGGVSGVMEAFISCFNQSLTPQVIPFRAELIVDGVTVFDQTFPGYLSRLSMPYPAGTSGLLRVTRPGSETGIYTINIGDVTCWVYDRPTTWSDPLIDKNARLTIIGDSWTTYYPGVALGNDGALGREIQALMTAAGGTGVVTSVGMGGQTAEWGLANFAALVTPTNPTDVLDLFWTNDKNSFGAAGYNRWLLAQYQIGLMSQAIDACPIFVDPLPTASVAQSMDHGTWAEKIGAGLPI